MKGVTQERLLAISIFFIMFYVANQADTSTYQHADYASMYEDSSELTFISIRYTVMEYMIT